jgi:uncharacterized secreted protein with C-terminal beta-propeller domain
MMASVREIGELIKKVYKEKVGGYPDDLVRVYQKKNRFYVIRNDDTQTAILKEDIVSKNEDKIAEALKNFTLID